MTVTCPCKGCKDRTPTCHDSCAAYLLWREEVRAGNDARRMNNAITGTAYTLRAAAKKRVGWKSKTARNLRNQKLGGNDGKDKS